jgi:hypothetical protein
MVTGSRSSSRRRVLRVSLGPSDFATVQHFAEAAGVTPDQLGAVWLLERIRRSNHALTRPEGPGAADSGARRSPDGNTKQRAVARLPRRRGAALHDEIVSVLKASGAPMTVVEIAAQIRRRGTYTAPRTGKPITTESVSTRVANPQYRSLFARDGRLLTLAAPNDDGESSS